ncbi:MAG: transmembrane 220 family protein [Leptospiraceae bacterium]|nr:transmembrane 220 family protein [Leptospiraceae bacterium]
MKILLQSLNGFFLVAFLFSVAVQYNDPDPVVWMLIYGAAALVCLLFLLGRLPRWTAAVPGVISLIWALLLLPDIASSNAELSTQAVFGTAQMINERVELVREMGGLLIVCCWMGVLSLVQHRRRHRLSSAAVQLG